MKKIFKGLMCMSLAGAMAMGIGLSGCSKSEHRDPESSSSALQLAVGAVDQKFNPFFSTSQNDVIITNMTQASMIGADSDGELAFGDKYPVVTLDYKETYYSAANVEIGTGNGKTVTGSSDKNGSTKYEFLIKNDMKFSDGEPLTIADVLFNLYVYLDPAYSGSSTIYSTKIKGLAKYRTQNPDAEEDSTIDMTGYYAQGLERRQALVEWAENGAKDTLSDAQKKDLETVKKLYREELNTDWSSIETGWTESYKEYRFTEAWQVFYYVEGIVYNQTETDAVSAATVNLKDNDDKYLTSLDPEWDPVEKKFKVDPATGETYKPEHQVLIDEMASVLSSSAVSKYMADNPGVSEENAKLALSKEHVIESVYEANTADTEIDYILTYCATGSTALDAFMRDAMSQDRPTEGLEVPRISGITVSNTDAAEYGKKFNGKSYDEKHDILRIEINGIDPKAKWNFGFAVAPMHYYSDEAHFTAAMNDYKNGKFYDNTAENFGVEYKNVDWFNDVLGKSSKTGVPVGAGAYKCVNHNWSDKNVSSTSFFYNNMAFYARNDNFETMGKDIDNAKIKYVNYKVTREDRLVSALKKGELDYGEPTAKADNLSELSGGKLRQIRYLAGGYGYVGINPKYVPDIEVRQAIMHAFDTSAIYDYYGSDLVNVINRPMSTTSWAYPKNSTRKYEKWDENDSSKVQALIESSGNWTLVNGKYRDINNNPLKLSFVIAGESTDHPAFNMFLYAKTLLEKWGFEISVDTDIQALKKLATGDLAVWAAAWSSSIDPDPYQIYSVNSNATSTKNWYKDGIINSGAQGDYATEYELAMRLNEKIEAGRQTLNRTDRISIYADALDIIMDMAVEFPTYQRYNLCVYNSEALDSKSMHTSDASFNMGPIDELWKVAYKK